MNGSPRSPASAPERDTRLDYPRDFYRAMEAESSASAAEVVPRVIELVAPRSVVDVGCATGVWLAEFASRGAPDVLGLDFGTHPGDLRIPAARFRPVDLSRRFRLERDFDLALCLEVGEHLPEPSAVLLVESLAELAPVLLFSAAIPFQGGTNHVNEQWPDYWARHFARHDFVAVDILRREFWENARVAWWYRQNAIFYVKRTLLPRYPALAALGPSEPQRLVHPLNYVGHANPEHRGMRQLLGELPAASVRLARRLAGKARADGGEK